eukprot:jgi/Bigna1/86801/estExt_fgenesh1_pg.C_140027
MASDIKASILNSDGHGNSLPNGEHKRAPSPGIPDNRRSSVTTNIISNIAIMRARLARIGQATMLLAPRASAVVDVISAQLDELQDIVKNMADNSIRLLLDRPESDWDYNNHAVQHYQATALKRKRETKEDDFPWLVPSRSMDACFNVTWADLDMFLAFAKVFPFVPIKKTAVPFDSKLTGAVVIDKVLARISILIGVESLVILLIITTVSVRKKCGKSKDPRLKFKNDTFTLRAPGTCEHIHRDQLVLSSEFVREALFNGRNVNLNLDIKPAEMTHFDPNKSHIDNFVDSLKHSLVDVRTEYKDAKSVKHADVLWFHGSCVPYANKDLTNPVARIRLKFAEFPVPLIAPPTKLRMKSRPSYLKLHHKDPKSFKVRIIKGTNLAAKDPNGKSDPYVKGLVEVDLLDPKFDHEPGVPMRFTCKCRQRFSRKDEIVSGSLTFEYTVNIPSSEAKLSKLLRVDLMHNLSKADYDLIWKSRARLFKRPHMLPRLLQKVGMLASPGPVGGSAWPKAPVLLVRSSGDDLRQDILTLQMLEVMNRIWMKDGMDMKLKIYKVLATGKNRHGAGVGLIQVVDQSSTTSDIQAEFGSGGALGAFEPTVLVQYLEEHNTDWKHTAKRNFTQSCALETSSTEGYCVATLVLGIGDRHNGNIMCTKDGHLFHIDFGHFLGNFKSKMGFKRERTPFVFTPEMAKVIGDGKAKSEDYKNFLELCKRAYRLVRQQADLLEMLFILMTSAGMPELVEKSDINYLRNQLNLHMSDSASGKHLETLIEKSRANAYKRLDNFIHIWKHG